MPPGLCDSCGHSRVVASKRGGRFYLCRLSETDPRFARYPALPVRRCEGYKPDKERVAQRRADDMRLFIDEPKPLC